MPSILDADYMVPHIYATGYGETFATGANAPIRASGIDINSNEKGEFVIKLKAGETMQDPSANLKELLAAFIAMELDIPVAAPVMVEVTAQFVETITDKAAMASAQKSLGFNYGSVYIDGYTTLLLTTVPDKLVPFAQELFAFDMLIQNIDRTKQKPNMLTNGEEIVAIDHEKAFSFIFALFTPVNIGEIPEHQKDWIRNHILYPLVKGKPYVANSFMDKCQKLDNDFWNRAWQLTPDDWKTEHFTTIKDRITSFIDNRKAFIKELQIIMS